MSRASELADRFRDGDRRGVAAEVACDGPTALALASLLDRGELSRLRREVDRYLDSPTDPAGSVMVGGEARGGPVTLPLRGTVR